MVIFHSYVSLPEGREPLFFLIHRLPQGLVHHPRECVSPPNKNISFSQRTFRRRTWSSSGNIKMDHDGSPSSKLPDLLESSGSFQGYHQLDWGLKQQMAVDFSSTSHGVSSILRQSLCRLSLGIYQLQKILAEYHRVHY